MQVSIIFRNIEEFSPILKWKTPIQSEFHRNKFAWYPADIFRLGCDLTDEKPILNILGSISGIILRDASESGETRIFFFIFIPDG